MPGRNPVPGLALLLVLLLGALVYVSTGCATYTHREFDAKTGALLWETKASTFLGLKQIEFSVDASKEVGTVAGNGISDNGKELGIEVVKAGIEGAKLSQGAGFAEAGVGAIASALKDDEPEALGGSELADVLRVTGADPPGEATSLPRLTPGPGPVVLPSDQDVLTETLREIRAATE